MPWAAFLSLCCQGAETSMPVAETKAPVTAQALGGWAGQNRETEEGPVLFRRVRVFRARGLVRCGRWPWEAAQGRSQSRFGMSGVPCTRLSVAPWYVQ